MQAATCLKKFILCTKNLIYVLAKQNLYQFIVHVIIIRDLLLLLFFISLKIITWTDCCCDICSKYDSNFGYITYFPTQNQCLCVTGPFTAHCELSVRSYSNFGKTIFLTILKSDVATFCILRSC